jgi:hypothetical protein
VPDGPSNDALYELEELERALSQQRRRLQDRIDFARTRGGTPDAATVDHLLGLEEKEREVSARRRALHRQIDAARARRTS